MKLKRKKKLQVPIHSYDSHPEGRADLYTKSQHDGRADKNWNIA